MRARKRQHMTVLKNTERLDLVLDADVYQALRKKYPRGIGAGIRDALAYIARRA